MDAADVRRRERHRDVDDDLAAERALERIERRSVRGVRNAQDDDVRVTASVEIASAGYHRSARRETRRRFAAALGVARPDDDRMARARPPDGEAAAFLPGAADDTDVHGPASCAGPRRP